MITIKPTPQSNDAALTAQVPWLPQDNENAHYMRLYGGKGRADCQRFSLAVPLSLFPTGMAGACMRKSASGQSRLSFITMRMHRGY